MINYSLFSANDAWSDAEWVVNLMNFIREVAINYPEVRLFGGSRFWHVLVPWTFLIHLQQVFALGTKLLAGLWEAMSERTQAVGRLDLPSSRLPQSADWSTAWTK